VSARRKRPSKQVLEAIVADAFTTVCWVVHFNGDAIDRVRPYLDSAMVARLFEENPIQP
jgi:hypothetical protein